MKLLLVLLGTAAAIQLQPRSAKRAALTPTRRGALWLPVAGWLAARRPAAAEDFDGSLKALYKAAQTAKLTKRSAPGEPPAEAFADDCFVGTYTDPNHPGGTRTISMEPRSIGIFRLAKVSGGGGRGEPESYVLPALVYANQITVDFSVPPKGGPPGFTGTFTSYPARGKSPAFVGIKWADGNKWPQMEEKK
mmetsp:Transcript_5073/g.15028  ORF Transcript_5073/g.15028 Transcript_5073/m.15028 type:complete len:192 (-) Transcript_5073:56-631(-)